MCNVFDMNVNLGTDDEQWDLESFAVLQVDNGHIGFSERLKIIQSVVSKYLNRDNH